MRLPRDLSGEELARLLRRYDYEVVRQTSSHLQLTSSSRGTEHHVTIPAHRDLAVGTPHAILSDVADYLEIERTDLIQALFGR